MTHPEEENSSNWEHKKDEDGHEEYTNHGLDSREHTTHHKLQVFIEKREGGGGACKQDHLSIISYV